MQSLVLFVACFYGSVRIWTIQGEFLGIFGAAIPRWNIKRLELPIWENGEIRVEEHEGESGRTARSGSRSTRVRVCFRDSI